MKRLTICTMAFAFSVAATAAYADDTKPPSTGTGEKEPTKEKTTTTKSEGAGKSQETTEKKGSKAKTPAAEKVTEKMQFNDVLNVPMMNGCRYVATIKGSVQPVAKSSETSGGSKAKGEGVVDPSLSIQASVSCPTAAAIQVTDNVMKTGPLTREQLEQAIERRASVLSDASGMRCLYMPDFRLEGAKLSAVSVSYLCPVTSGGSQQGQAAPKSEGDTKKGKQGETQGGVEQKR